MNNPAISIRPIDQHDSKLVVDFYTFEIIGTDPHDEHIMILR